MTTYSLKNTTWGWIGVSIGYYGICAVILPCEDKIKADGKMKKLSKEARWDDSLHLHRALPFLVQIEEYLTGVRTKFCDYRLELSKASQFSKEVWSAVEQIPYGQTVTYGQVAEMIGRSGASRAVGQALAKNPVPLFVPCHRVVSGGGGLGGFSAGLSLKEKLLDLEGISIKEMAK